MDSMAEIEKCLEQHAVLSTSWLSNELQISVRAAIDLMQQYRESVEGIIAMYRLSSKSASGCFRIEIVSEQDLDKRRDESMLHHQLYCIQRSRSDMTKSKLVEVSLLQAEELLNTSTATNGSFLDNAFGGVKVNGLDIKAVGDRIFSSQNLSFDAAAAKAAASSVAAFQPPVVNKPLSGSTLSLGRSSNLTSKPAASTTVAKSKPVSSSATLKKIDEKNAEIAKRFFAATESKPKTETEEMDTSGAGAGDDDEEWDDGAPKRFVTKKPKAVVHEDEMDLGALDNFENTKEPDSNAMDVEEDEVDSSQPEQEGKSHGKKKPKVDVLKRGAMDDYMEDAAIDEHKRKQAEQGTEQPKKKKRVLVEKSSFDDRGYMVMEMAWEEVTDDEGDSMPDKSAIGALKPTTSVTKENTKNYNAEIKKEDKAAATGEGKLKPAAKKEKPAAVGQKSVMSFFKKS